jgi:hypothetical protein
MKSLDQTFWRMTITFIVIIILSLGAIYAIKQYSQGALVDSSYLSG